MPFIETKAKSEYKIIDGKKTHVITPECEVTLTNTETGKAKVTMGVKNYPSDSSADSTYSPFEVVPASQKFDTRARGRYANLQIQNENAGETWRYGTFQVDVQADGRR